jgi:predicted ester cyclase
VATAVAEDDWVMGRCIASATHSTVVMGVPPTGRRVETSFWDLHRFDDAGLIVETWNLMDGVAIMRQLGLLPSG